ncbi:unnamed protein product [Ceutorhynchus assimilis]|uniref:Uncharacterized protein n=1 Tax=Ceutorhynchus assimilis TaxID=467358 RepID=A0A9N9QPF8_9CUCU|nr:unnamed protein product [Ceutorhynchus assimilis]
MNDSSHIKMNMPSTIFFLCLCFNFSLQFDNNSSALTTPNYSIDPQLPGFEGSKLKSGAIVLADKRTLFIADLRHRHFDGELEFWVGTGSDPFSDTHKQLVYRDGSLANHTNIYVTLPENLTLDNITFIEGRFHNESLDYVSLQNVTRNDIRSYDESSTEINVYRIPKCCLQNQLLNESVGNQCGPTAKPIDLDINIFESNETGLDPDITINSTEYRLIPYIQDLNCSGDYVYRVIVTDRHGLIYNSSMIIEGTAILSHSDFCVDVYAMENSSVYTVTLQCSPQENTDPDFYMPVLIISAICFALTGAAYGIIFKPKHIYKGCIIIFAGSMCLAFISLVIMQVQNNNATCRLFGCVFLFTVIFAFLWLMILCLELLYLVIYPIEETRYDKRWRWYLGISLGITSVLFFVSIFSGGLGIPDVSDSFIMFYRQNSCRFYISSPRTYIIFTPMIVSILGSFTSLIILTTQINKNEANPKITNHVDWVMNRNSYKFLSRTYFIILIVATFWLINIFLHSNQLESGKTQLALDVIKASLGKYKPKICDGPHFLGHGRQGSEKLQKSE